jgi:hypothetical protein
LDQWSITSNLLAPGKLGKTGEHGDMEAVGDIDWDPDHEIAWMNVDKSQDREEVEITIIHELVHLRNIGHTRQRGYDVNEERATEAIARALYNGWNRRKKAA